MITIKIITQMILMLLGLISLGIGVLGIILPLLPGIPFLIFATFCFAKSSRRLDRRFRRTTLYKKYVRAFLYNKGLTRKEKIRINLIADFFIVMSIFMVDILIVKILLIILALYKHYYFMVRIKTV